MDSGAQDVLKSIGEVSEMLDREPELMVEGFGILLLGKRFDRDAEERNLDPTLVLFGGQAGVGDAAVMSPAPGMVLPY